MATYKYGGIKPDKDSRRGIVSSRLILEGSSTNPKKSVEVGEEIELTDEEYESLKSRYKLTGKSDDGEGDNSGSGEGDPANAPAPASGAQHASAGAEAGTAGRKAPQAKS